MYFAIFATHRPDSTELRLQARPTHREYLRDMAAYPEVMVVHGGPTLAEDEATMNGSMMIVEAPSLVAAKAFSAGDPYRRTGLFAACEVRPWAWILGRPYTGD